jgi:inorganic pyrophosphatase
MSIHDVTACKHVPREFNVIIEIPQTGKWVKVLGWSGVELAHAEILDGIKRHQVELQTRT